MRARSRRLSAAAPTTGEDMKVAGNVLESIGRTPLVRLNRAAATVVTLMVDSGMKYVSTDLYR